MSNEKDKAIIELVTRMADNAMIMGHRNSEWIGVGPVLEEDIAFGSLAQDKTGHAYNLYLLLQQLGDTNPDEIVFNREEKDFKSCHLVEYPIGEYDFSLVRHFLFDHSEYVRYDMLTSSTFQPLANLAKKYKPEIKYHIFHADTWMKQLGNSTEEAHARMQSAFNIGYELANSIFEPGSFEDLLRTEGVFEGEKELRTRWIAQITPILQEAGIKIPELSDKKIHFGGRNGFHTKYMKSLLNEMGEVYSSKVGEEW